MRPERHLKKAQRYENTQEKLDPKDDWETIIETCYGAALNYIAYYCQIRFKEHMDTHKGLPRFLDNHNLRTCPIV